MDLGHINGNNKAKKFVELKIDENNTNFLRRCADGTNYDINFLTNRLSFQLQHHAMKWFEIHELFHLLISNPVYKKSYIVRYELMHVRNKESNYVRKKELNDEQNEAVKSITTEEYAVPFLLFGPPGKRKFQLRIQESIIIFSG